MSAAGGSYSISRKPGRLQYSSLSLPARRHSIYNNTSIPQIACSSAAHLLGTCSTRLRKELARGGHGKRKRLIRTRRPTQPSRRQPVFQLELDRFSCPKGKTSCLFMASEGPHGAVGWSSGLDIYG